MKDKYDTVRSKRTPGCDCTFCVTAGQGNFNYNIEFSDSGTMAAKPKRPLNEDEIQTLLEGPFFGKVIKVACMRMPVSGRIVSSGVTCKSCKNNNEYAEPNRPDGSYVCFNCRY